MKASFALALVACVALCAAQVTTNEDAVGEKLDNLRKTEQNSAPLDPLPASNVHKPTHAKTEQELMAEDEDAVFVGRDVDALTHPSILSKVPPEHVGRGNIQGRDKLCAYLLDASLGVDETADNHGVRLYNLAARLECEWAACRLCQQRMKHVFQYCQHHGVKDFTFKGVCEDNNAQVQTTRLRKMVFHDNPNSCRAWKDMQAVQLRCAPSDGAFCQGAYTIGEMCHALGLNSKAFLQRGSIDELTAWACKYSAHQCGASGMLAPSEGVDVATPDFGNEPGALGLDVV